MSQSNSHQTYTIADCRIIRLQREHFPQGNLSVVENFRQLPYDIKRVYYLYDVPSGESRGGHSHLECVTFLVAVSGSFKVELFDGKHRVQYTLYRPDEGLLITPGIWRTLTDFSSASTCLVLASEEFSEADYVRDIEQYRQLTEGK